MISTDFKRVQLQNIVEHQLPSFVREDFPLITEFLKQYYISQEYPGASVDLIQNIDEYLKLENLTNNSEFTELSSDVSFFDETINVKFDLTNNIFGTYQFPEKYGLIQINDEIILYTGKTNNSFTGCVRGFSGVTSYTNTNSTDNLIFSTSEIAEHQKDTKVTNLSALLLKEFLTKIKYQFTPGFEERELDSDVNQRLFISRAKDFYQTKGTDESFKILFGALYGEKVEVIKPKDYLFRPSDAQYRVTKDLVVESISGNPLELLNNTLYQDSYDNYGIERAYASVTNIEKLFYKEKEYYQISVDFDYSKDISFDGSVLGNFSVHPQTKIITTVSSGSTVIDVDSTVGFPDSGELVVNYPSGTVGILTYTSKTINQFIGISTTLPENINSSEDIRLNIYAYGYVGFGTTSRIDVRIGSVLSEFLIDGSTYYFSKNDTAKIKSLGITTSGPRVDSWIYNLATKYDVESIILSDSSNFTYKIKTFVKNNFSIGDNLTITDSTSVSKNCHISDITDAFTFSITGQGQILTNRFGFVIQKNLSKPKVSSNLSEYSYITNYVSNIQNTYSKFNQDVLVAASSLPTYYNQPLNFYDRKIDLDGTYSGEIFTTSVPDHGYYTGDAVYYKPYTQSTDVDGTTITVTSKFDNMEEGVYYVERLSNPNQFKLATSQANLYNKNYISVSGIVTSNTLEPIDFYNKTIQHQNLLKEIKTPNNESGNYITEPGRTGILINGVEILNYKSDNVIYYGSIDNITVSAKGTDYDVINPPILSINDAVGTGATGICAVKGSFKQIDILDSGFDYVSKPIVTITGGNGTGAKADVNTKFINHSVPFNATLESAFVNLTDDTIGFSTYHKFRNVEKVIYKTDNQQGISGIVTDSVYFAKSIDSQTIKLYKNEGDAISGVNTISLNSYGVGVHRIQSFDKKQVISNIVVIDSGENYENKKRVATPSGINTASNQINIVNHQYNTGDIVQYSYDAVPVSGISSLTSYIVTKIDDNNFRLSNVGVGSISKLFYFDNKQYINLETIGSGNHIFNYEPISVSVIGEIGVSTFSGQDFSAKIQPIVRGSIESVQVTSSGVGYGTDIINYNRQPLFTLSSGSSAELLPIVDNGRIVEVLVTNEGKNYNSPPRLEISGTGKYAKLVPIIIDGKIKSVKIDSPGTGYSEKTRINVIPSGTGALFFADIQKWTINLFEKYLNIISDDDGILAPSFNDEFGIQYTHLYAPRKLRESIYGKNQDNQIQYGVFDLQKTNIGEIKSLFHSPIIGWAYDGNPIYGPYGFSEKSGSGTVREMKSSYVLVTKTNRPQYKQGFFVEDYEFDGSGDLDEHNGRFCVTPEFPNGVYAYFATINPDKIETSSTFIKYKIPVFPYLIGNSFKSKPNLFNYTKNINQKSYDLNTTSWFRNTTPYNLTEEKSYYDFLFQPNKIKSQTINIDEVAKGSIDSVGIITGGSDYKINDKIIFDDSLFAQKANAKVDIIKGKPVVNISAASTTISELELFPYDSSGSFIAFSTSPHNLTNNDLISLSGINTSSKYLQNSFNIGVKTERLILNTGIGTEGTTGIVTYFNISGNLNLNIFSIRENDILSIENEKVKVLNVDSLNSRIRVLRAQDGTVSSAHTASTVLYENTRKFTFKSLPENNITFELNKEFYFNPEESLGVGTASGVGIGTTIFFSNPGAGITQIFIPTQSIYIPKHDLNNGDTLIYSSNGGNSIEILNASGITTTLSNLSTVYVAKISNDLIGISTYKVGLGSTGTFVGIASTTSTTGLLYFVSVGSGSYHSFKTQKEKTVTAEANKNYITVSTGSTHGLSLNDEISVSLKSGITTTITVKYNDYNRRIIFNPKNFTSGDVDTLNNTITIQNHGFNSGDKVIYTSSSPSGGLVDNKIYYIFRFTKDKVKLCENRYQSFEFNPETVDITSASLGTLSPINPPLSIYKNNTIKFDLSDISLSSSSGFSTYSAFDMNIYTDAEFKNIFDSSTINRNFEVLKVGQVGITSNAALLLTVSDFLPKNLYYKFSPINSQFISQYKKEIYIDTEVANGNQINLVNSSYEGTFNISGVGTTTFTYNITKNPENYFYDSTSANIAYTTKSTSASGEIEKISITYPGSEYVNVVGVSTVKSDNGSGCILEPRSNSIGKIISNTIQDIGFDFPTDNTLRPVCNLPEILLMEPLSSFEEIGITSAGKNYSIPPKLVVVDGYTKKVVDDVDLSYKIGDTKVTILKNTFGIYDISPRIIPINNPNGVKIKNITYNSATKEVTVGLNTGFSDSFPFSVGDKVLIENVSVNPFASVGIATTGKGYNSSNYDYALFTLTKVSSGVLGGSVGVVTYSLSEYLQDDQIPGNYDSINSSGRIVAEKDFPVFDIKLKKNDFILGETVTSNNNSGQVESWNNQIELLKVSTENEFSVGDILVGQTSKTQGAIKSKIDFNSEIKLGASSIVKKGWNRSTGFLNFDTERISDNNYYQNFSYSLKSKVPFENWKDSVSSLNHTAGFLKFSDLVIESRDNNFKGVYSDNLGSSVDTIIDIYDEVNINCYSDFDLVTENELFTDGNTISEEIYFNSRVLTDYYESFGNRVLIIDDISTQFNSTPRPTKFSIVDLFNINHKSKKYFTYVRDKRYINERQFLIVSLLHDGSQGFLNQYARVESQLDLGSFDFSISGAEGQLLFYPTKYAVNNYNISFASFDIISSVSGIGSTTLGDVVNIKTSKVSTSSGLSTTIVSTGSTYRASKIILQIDGNNGELQYDELNLIHDGTDVELLNYGQLTNHSSDAFSSSGLGTYNAYISGGNINVDFYPKVGLAVTVNTLSVSIASTLSTGIGTQYLGYDVENISFIDSSFTAISSSPTPTENVIARYKNISPDDHNCSYFIVSVEDTTNNRYEMSEVAVLNYDEETYITEYGNLITHSGLGTIGVGNSASYTNLYYTPLPDIDVEVRVFQTSLQLVDAESTTSTEIDLNNALISAGYGFYQGTQIDIKRAFDLNHKQTPIFVRHFNAEDSSVVDIENNTFFIPNHFFNTGEELEYFYNDEYASPIGIATTSFIGIGETNILPPSVFAIKLSEQKIQLARSAEDALKTIAVPLDITSLGVGTFPYHAFKAKNQNTKCIIAIDNYIQSPIVSTSVTTGLTTHIGIIDDIIKFSGITSFFSGDLIKIDNEIMRINTVGLGSTNYILVDRPWMGTGIATHSQYAMVTKIEGDYNIVDNTINFITAPQGPIPIGSITNPPDERDWTGITTFSKFQGRTFLRSAEQNSSEETYIKNVIFDDISQNFNATQKTFALKSNQQNVTGFSTNNSVILINGIFQGPTGQLPILQDYTLNEGSGITSITFTGSATSVAYDPNNATIPIGGIIVSVGSTSGFGYQPLVSAGGTAIVSIAGTISSISIGNSGSGYRAGIQTTVRVGVKTSMNANSSSIQFIGTAAISNGNIVSVAVTNPGVGYTATNPPIVIFDSPLSYSDIPLIYSTESPSGFGTQATIDIVVGQGSSIIDFEIKNPGYNYGQKQILTIPTGGLVGIPTNPLTPFSEFQITIDKTISDKFSGWNLGELEVLDKIEDKFDGRKKSFTISVNSSPLSIRSAKGSNIDVQATLLVFLNDILQVPGEGYTFTGGSVITFAEPPKGSSSDGSTTGDKCKILFYKGSGDIDVVFRDVLETVKIGDTLTIKNQDERIVTDIISSDSVETNPYSGENINGNSDNLRLVEWCKQTSDKIINGQIISKSRTLNEALINPSTYIIQSVGIGSTVVYVESVKSFFDSVKENQTTRNRQTIIMISQDSIVGAAATAVVSAGGTISSIIIDNGGVGYTTSPSVTIGNAVGFGTTASQRAEASSSISIGGTVSSITITSPGIGYTSSNPPQVLIEVPNIIYETNFSSSYSGDFGQVIGISTTTVGIASTALVFDFYIPVDSVLRDTSIVSTAKTVSGIQTGYYFVIQNSNIGNGVTSLYQDGSILGIGTQFLDGVYEVSSVSIAQTSCPGVGLTYVARVITSISDYNSLTGIGYSAFFGEFSWGRIDLGSRIIPQTFNSYTKNGLGGITTSTILNRVSPLKYLDYF